MDKVDILFEIDDSTSMEQKQKKLADVLPNLISILTTGNKTPKPAGATPDFPPVKSMHIGVISQDMGVGLIGEPAPSGYGIAPPSCGPNSFLATAPDPIGRGPMALANPLDQMRLDKPFGDDGRLLATVDVAVSGMYTRGAGQPLTTDVTLLVPPKPECQHALDGLQHPWIDFTAGQDDPATIATRFGCMTELGRNGCGLEQQLDAMYKAVAPNTAVFSRNTRGNGLPSGPNAGFLRDDAILAIVLLTDEDDCSGPDTAGELWNGDPKSTLASEDLNIRCQLKENQDKYLYPASRYVDGLKALKSTAFQDRIIFAAITGIPTAVNLGGVLAHSGVQELQTILDRPDMQFVPRNVGTTTQQEATPVCTNIAENYTAAPGRRYLPVAQGFGENGVITSICEDEFGSALDAIISKIAAQLQGACLPRTLHPDANGLVECNVVEIKSATDGAPCDASKGRSPLPTRNVGGTNRVVCNVQQVPVLNGAPKDGIAGWYYDDFSTTVKQDCKTDPQRIAFTSGAEASSGADTRFECFQPVTPNAGQDAVGRDAVGLPCSAGNDPCAHSSDSEYTLVCVAGSCQIGCASDANCPAGWTCTAGSNGSDHFCLNPTCPLSTFSGSGT